jgi:hypothetical protein
MPNKLRSTGARVSFFAFQDMITTVTGVLLLVTLLLTLYLNRPAVSAPESARNQARRQLDLAQAELAAKLAQLRSRQLEQLALTNRVFVLAEPDRSGKQPVLVVLSATNGSCMALGQTNSLDFSARSDQAPFQRLLDTLDPLRQRLVFYIRPSGIAHFEACQRLAASRSFDIGYDAAEEDRQYLLASP